MVAIAFGHPHGLLVEGTVEMLAGYRYEQLILVYDRFLTWFRSTCTLSPTQGLDQTRRPLPS
jgi:hypothetical protein